MHPSPDVQVSHVVTQFETHVLSLVAQALVHAPPSHAAAQLCSISAHVPAQLVASMRQSSPHPEASFVGAGAPSTGGPWESFAPFASPCAGAESWTLPSSSTFDAPPSSPLAGSGSKASKSWKHPTNRIVEAASAARSIKILL
jgi:hypothetical protein